MTSFDFADSYRRAGQIATAEVIGLRSEPFETLLSEIDAAASLTYGRLLYGLPLPSPAEKFAEAFRSKDAAFSMVDNAQEVASLAACLLEASMAASGVNGTISAISLMCLQAMGLRQPLVRSDLIPIARHKVMAKAIAERQRPGSDVSVIKLPSKGKAAALAGKIAEAPSWEAVAEAMKADTTEGYEAVRALTLQVKEVFAAMSADVADLREEVGILWWHFGGASRLIERPFAEMDAGLVAILAGIDLADLSKSYEGVAAIPALLQRVVDTAKKGRGGKVRLDNTVEALDDANLQKLEFFGALAVLSDACPIQTALSKRRDIGDGWAQAYKKATGFDASLSALPLEIGLQAFWEQQLLHALS